MSTRLSRWSAVCFFVLFCISGNVTANSSTVPELLAEGYKYVDNAGMGNGIVIAFFQKRSNFYICKIFAKDNYYGQSYCIPVE